MGRKSALHLADFTNPNFCANQGFWNTSVLWGSRMSGADTEHVMRTLWPSFKRRLERKFAGEEWIRPMYLLRVLRASANQLHLLATLPGNGRIIACAVSRLPEMRAMLAPNFSISLTTYPDAWQLDEVRRRFGIDWTPKRKQSA